MEWAYTRYMQGLYKIKTVAQLSGYPTELLRAWERRYCLLQPVRTATGHRLYTQDDLTVLERIREMLGSGRTIGEVAILGRRGLLNPSDRAEPTGEAQLRQWREAAVHCALQLDSGGLERLVDQAFARVDPDRVIEQMILPSSADLGGLWHVGRASVASEHLMTAIYARRLEGMIEAELRHARPQPLVLVSCLAGEQHELGARLVTYYLSRQGIAPIYAAPGMPVEDLERVCDLRHPDHLLLSVSRATLLEENLAALGSLARRLQGQTRLHLGGLGVAGFEPRLREAGIDCWQPGRPLRELRL